MFVFVLNCGSSSFKYQLLDMSNENRVASGLVERIGIKDSVVEYAPAGAEKIKETVDIADHQTAIRRVLEKLVDPKIGVIKSLSDIAAIGHHSACANAVQPKPAAACAATMGPTKFNCQTGVTRPCPGRRRMTGMTTAQKIRCSPMPAISTVRPSAGANGASTCAAA